MVRRRLRRAGAIVVRVLAVAGLCLLVAVSAWSMGLLVGATRPGGPLLQSIDTSVGGLVLGVPRPVAASTMSWTQYWVERFSLASPPLRRAMTISFEESQITLDLELWMPSSDPRLTLGGPDRIDENLLAFVSAAFGQILVVQPVALPVQSYKRLQLVPDPANDRVGIVVRAETPPGWIGSAERDDLSVFILRPSEALGLTVPTFGALLHPQEDEITIKLGKMQLRHLSPAPTTSDAVTDDAITLRKATLDASRYGTYVISVGSGVPATPAGTAAPIGSDSLRRAIERFGPTSDAATANVPDMTRNVNLQKLVVYLGPRLFQMVASVLPLLIFLWLAARMPPGASPSQHHLATGVSGLLLFHFALNGTSVLPPLLQLVQLTIPALAVMIPTQQIQIDTTSGAVSLTSTWSLLSVAIIGVLLPNALRHWMRIPGPTSRARTVAWLGAAVAVAAMWAYLTYATLTFAGPLVDLAFEWTWLPSALVFGLCAMVLWAGLAAGYRLLVRLPAPAGAVSLAVVLVAAIFVLAPYPSLATLILWPLMIALSAGLVLALLWLAIDLVNRDGARVTFTRWQWWVVAGVAMMLALPLSPGADTARIPSLPTFAYRVDRMLPYLWIAGVVWLCYRHGRDGLRIDGWIRTIGLLAASTVMFGIGRHWLTVASFVVGWMLLERLVRPDSHWDGLKKVVDKVVHDRVKLLEQVLDVNAEERAYRERRRSLTKKLAAGEIEFDAYEKQLAERAAQVDKVHRERRVAGRPVRDVALTFGPYRTAWDNGVYGAACGLLFATPWILIFVAEALNLEASQVEYPVIELASVLLSAVTRWAVIGFLFGYFYPYLLGRNGLEKGLGLFLVAVLPIIATAALTNETSENWRASLFWLLQVFLQCSLLGLGAFDYGTLRQGRHDWRMVFEVHGITAAGASISSIAIAVGTTITTLLTTHANDLVKLAVQYVLPAIPKPPPGT